MKSGIGRPLALAVVLAGAALETIFARGNAVVAFCGAVAMLLCGWAIPLVSWREAAVRAGVRRPPLPRTHRAPHAPGPRPATVPAPAMVRPRPAEAQADRRRAVAVAEPVTTAAFPAPPRFGSSGAAANRCPWLLPRTPAPAAVQADEAMVGGLHVRAASVVGPGHRCQEPAAPRQDAYRLGRDPGGRFLIVAVADGLSSGARSELGADVAVRHVVDTVCAALQADPAADRLDVRAVFSGAAVAMNAAAEGNGLVPEDLSAVLAVAVVDSRPDEAGDHLLWVGWIGDASVWTLCGREWTVIAGDPKIKIDGIASNAVAACLPQHPDEATQSLFRVGGGAAIAVVTDGVGDALAQIPEANAYLAEHWARPPALGALLNDVCFDARQHLDDRTAVVLWTPEPQP